MADSFPVWSGWETRRLIGKGGYGAVYEIERNAYGVEEKAALKHICIPKEDNVIDEMLENGFDQASVTATFKSYLKSIVNEYALMREMKGAANIVNCDDFRVIQHDDGIGWDIFIKMELLTPLTKVLEKGVTDELVCSVAKDMCKALILCERRSIIHRDIKPQNIFVSRDGDYKLGDFGIARTMDGTTSATHQIGTYNYMAPEVFNNKPYNQTVDIYSLGMVLYWLMNERRLPFVPMPPAVLKAADMQTAMDRRMSGEPIPAPRHGNDKLKQIVLKACAYDAEKRYQNAQEMLDDLETVEFRKNTQEALPEEPEACAPEKPEPWVCVMYPAPQGETVGLWKAPITEKDNTAEASADEGATVQLGLIEKKKHTVKNNPPADAEKAVSRPKADESGKAEDAAESRQNKKKTIRTIIILVAVLLLSGAAFLLAWTLTHPSEGADTTSEREVSKDESQAPDTTAESETDEASRVLSDPDGYLWVAHGSHLLADGTLNDWGGKSTALYEASALTPISMKDLQRMDLTLYGTLHEKDVRCLYKIDLIFGTNDAGWTSKCMIYNEEYRANGSYVFKIVKCVRNGEGYAEDQWITDPRTAYAESLTPNQLFIPPWQEVPDKNGFTWADNPVVTGGAGRYTLVIAQYNNASSKDNPGYGIGLLPNEKEEGIPYEKISSFLPAEHTFGIIGSFAGSEWGSAGADVEMQYVGANTWEGTVALKAGDEYKVRADGDWNYNWGTKDGDNLRCTEDGAYVVRITFEGEAAKIQVFVDERAVDSVLNHYKNLFVVRGKVGDQEVNLLNIRFTASSESPVIACIARYGGGELLGESGEWYKISSGGYSGYVKKEYLATGEEAKQLALQHADKYVRAKNSNGLRIRSKPSESGEILATVPNDAIMLYKGEENGYYHIVYADRFDAYVNTEYCDYNWYLMGAIPAE